VHHTMRGLSDPFSNGKPLGTSLFAQCPESIPTPCPTARPTGVFSRRCDRKRRLLGRVGSRLRNGHSVHLTPRGLRVR
jgi:hypothetical protein